MTIDPQKLHDIMLASLFKEDEDTSNMVEAEGIVHKFGFHPERLESHRDEIVQMLMELPSEFMESQGGGWSFLQACIDKDGNQWASLHATIEELICLGLAIGRVKLLLSRSMWAVLPVGMPYYVVVDKVEEVIR